MVHAEFAQKVVYLLGQTGGRSDAGLGVIPADFTIDKALIQFKAMLGVAPDASPLVTSIARRTKEKGIEGDYAGEAAKLYAEKIRPALPNRKDDRNANIRITAA